MKLLEYISNPNGAYIDTGIKNVDYCKTELKLQGDRLSDQRIFGFNFNSYHMCWWGGTWYYGSDGSSNTDHYTNVVSSKITDLCEIIYNDEANKVSINGEKFGYKLDIVSNSNNRSITVFKEDYSGELYYGKLYYFKIINKQTNDVVIDLVPMENDDGQIGMYDKKNKKFYFSENGNEFIAGPEKQDLFVNLNNIYKDKRTNLLPKNIRKDVTILGVTGTAGEGTVDTSDADATAENIKETKVAYVKNTKITGTMKDNEILNITPSEKNRQVISAGYTSGGIVQAVDITELNDYKNCLSKAKTILSIKDI